MDKRPFASVDLVAVAPARDIHRRWSLVVNRDLFGTILVETAWGRIGSRGRQLIKSFADEAAALHYVRGLLARRRTAERRLGVGYVDRAGWGSVPLLICDAIAVPDCRTPVLSPGSSTASAMPWREPASMPLFGVPMAVGPDHRSAPTATNDRCST
ncbi:MAG TPA: hypothetical protein DEP91_03520 [Sphingomonas bacterium]|jgi:predicted DNA-binding WGR domain protein|uniref:WGR domain-containing protein n=1 Tax=Sphingomonas bacterium TaxID=1895847 RepID=A0A3D0WB76_9SPHN|nr:hypothetical protein [Sphingomonas bacterium]